MHLLPRVAPDVGIQYKQWTIPAGVSPNMIHEPASLILVVVDSCWDIKLSHAQ